jgi:hypothetical protein
VYWPGSIVAAKTFTALILFAAAYLLFTWSRKSESEETALIASGLLLIAPNTLQQIDAIGSGPFLLVLFALGTWLDQKYRAQQRPITGWYFGQMLLAATAVTLHPAGLAYVFALAWQWKQRPETPGCRKALWAGLGATLIVLIAMRAGWVALPWFSSPLSALGTGWLGLDPLDLTPRGWEAGIVPLVLLGLVLYFDRRFLLNDLLGLMLAGGVVVGMLAADGSWALLVLVILLYRGTPWLIRANSLMRGQSFMAQRGIVLAGLLILTTWFMQVDKAHARLIELDVLPPTDELIRTLARELPPEDESIRIASQWPGRTLLATKRATLPLPPAQDSGENLLRKITGLTHIVFAHNDPANAALARNIAEISAHAQTTALQPGGVIVQLRQQDVPGSPRP